MGKIKRIRLYCYVCGKFVVKYKIKDKTKIDFSGIICRDCFKKNKNEKNKNKI